MNYNPNGERFKEYEIWESRGVEPYNYASQEGLLKHILSNKIYNTTNSVLKIILTVYEKSIIYLLKYTDYLKNFKNIHWKNR